MRAWSKAHPQLWQFILFNVFANCATVLFGNFVQKTHQSAIPIPVF